jgi:predicted TIM-barrel fold metal-dependent hydrolase
LAHGEGRFKGIAVVPNHLGRDALRDAARGRRDRRRVQCDPARHRPLRGTDTLLGHLAALDMLVSLQVQGDQLVEWCPLIERSRVRWLIDHGGRPTAGGGTGQPGFQALLALARRGDVAVKLSATRSSRPCRRPGRTRDPSSPR